MRSILACIEPSQYYVLASFVYVFWRASFQNAVHRLVMLIMCNALITEAVADFLIYKGSDYGFVYSASMMVHNTMWLSLLVLHGKCARKYLWAIVGYLLFAGMDFICIEGVRGFNYLSFLAGAFLYILVYMAMTLRLIRKEDFDFFLTNLFLLLTAPVLFYVGLSFILGFRDHGVTSYKLIGNMSLYGCAVTLVNVVYYTMINVFIYKERKLRLCPN